jgi:hypothetical protein
LKFGARFFAEVIQQFKIVWGQPFSNILEFLELLAFDLDRASGSLG